MLNIINTILSASHQVAWRFNRFELFMVVLCDVTTECDRFIFRRLFYFFYHSPNFRRRVKTLLVLYQNCEIWPHDVVRTPKNLCYIAFVKKPVKCLQDEIFRRFVDCTGTMAALLNEIWNNNICRDKYCIFGWNLLTAWEKLRENSWVKRTHFLQFRHAAKETNAEPSRNSKFWS